MSSKLEEEYFAREEAEKLHKLHVERERSPFKVQAEAFCEHCYDLEPYDLVYDDGGTTWCMSCFHCGDYEHDSDDLKYWEKVEKEEKIKYFKSRLQDLESK